MEAATANRTSFDGDDEVAGSVALLVLGTIWTAAWGFGAIAIIGRALGFSGEEPPFEPPTVQDGALWGVLLAATALGGALLYSGARSAFAT